jgi:hypothetical protein
MPIGEQLAEVTRERDEARAEVVRLTAQLDWMSSANRRQTMQHSDDVLRQYVVYNSPKDFPGKYVVREWTIVRGSDKPVACADARAFETLEEARRGIPGGMVKIPRHPKDDVVIVEVWT